MLQKVVHTLFNINPSKNSRINCVKTKKLCCTNWLVKFLSDIYEDGIMALPKGETEALFVIQGWIVKDDLLLKNIKFPQNA